MPSYPQLLHEQFIAQSERPMEFGGLPVSPKSSTVPIVPLERWHDVGGALEKTYRFRLPMARDEFVVSLLQYERETQHNAHMVIDEGQVGLRIETKDLGRVTELDFEYAKFSDLVFRDIVSRPNIVGSDEFSEGY